ncbi:UBX domain-containing protein 11 [Numenius arquata]|uniref:UBX domain-containing protein 11 n=1 Tax=Numenius arquata TaxID=31919 RepID=UPI003D309260
MPQARLWHGPYPPAEVVGVQRVAEERQHRVVLRLGPSTGKPLKHSETREGQKSTVLRASVQGRRQAGSPSASLAARASLLKRPSGFGEAGKAPPRPGRPDCPQAQARVAPGHPAEPHWCLEAPEVTAGTATEDNSLSPRTKSPAQGSLLSCSRGTILKKNMQGAARADVDPMSSMMQKITLLEQEIEKQAQEIQLKDRRIAELEEKMKTLQKGEDAPDLSTAEELEIRCLQLQTQVWEMERFLNDYGLIWVGERHEQLEDLESLKDEEELPANSLWKPGEAVVSKQQIDFDLILENVKDLNVLAGEGISQIEHTPGGARLRQPKPLPLTLYQNGIVMFNGPFRPYEDPSTQQCLQDIMDGYFPSELQMRYPDGIPLEVTDRRDMVFQERDLPGSFPGHGQVVGHSKSSEVQKTTEIPGHKDSSEKVLNKFSKSSKHRGEVIGARSSARTAQQGAGGLRSSKEILVETPRLSALERVKTAEEAEASAPAVCTLRIKSESGEQTYIVKMLFTETIGDLRQHLTHARGGDSDSYEIISTFPQRVYADNSRSLQECGLVPSASLLLRRRDPSQQEGTGLQTA